MAAGDSPTSIVNMALAMLGEPPISNLSPPSPPGKAARLCAQFYDPSRRAMLRAHPFRCAKRQFQAAAAAAALPFGGTAYPVPSDYIRMYDMAPHRHRRWEVMNLAGIGLCVVSHGGGPLDEDYIFDLVDATQMDPLLVKTVAAEVAAAIALPLTRDASLKTQAQTDRDTYLSLARTVSAQEASAREWDADVILGSRY